jgi:hypothetical protein
MSENRKEFCSIAKYGNGEVITTLLVLALLLIGTSAAYADTLINDDGVTCEAPEGYNYAPFGDVNILGMDSDDYCSFPLFNLTRDQQEGCDAEVLNFPICNDELVVSPSQPVRPCYRLIED